MDENDVTNLDHYRQRTGGEAPVHVVGDTYQFGQRLMELVAAVRQDELTPYQARIALSQTCELLPQ